MRGERDVDKIIRFIVEHFNINDGHIDQPSLKFTKSVLTRSRLDTHRVKIKE